MNDSNISKRTKVIVLGVSERVKEHHLKEIFELCGKVKHVNLRFSRSLSAEIEFDTEEEAIEAVRCFDSGRIADRNVKVKLLGKKLPSPTKPPRNKSHSICYDTDYEPGKRKRSMSSSSYDSLYSYYTYYSYSYSYSSSSSSRSSSRDRKRANISRKKNL